MRVIIITPSHKIEGDIYILPGSRLTDLLNVKARNDFIPVTSAVIYTQAQESAGEEVDFISLNRDSIVMIWPVGDGDMPKADLSASFSAPI